MECSIAGTPVHWIPPFSRLTKRCQRHPETASHALFRCSDSLQVWRHTPFFDSLSDFKNLSGLDTLTGLFWRLGKAEFNLVCMLCWNIWNSRNIALHSGLKRSAEDIVLAAGDLLMEYQNTSSAPSVYPKSQAVSTKIWQAPPHGNLKLNSDAAIRIGQDFIGIGAAIRDSSGKVVAAISKPIEAMLNSGSLSLGDAMFIISDIQALQNETGVSYCQAIPRESNSLAHCLAKLALSSGKELLWRDVDPSCIFPGL